MKPAVLLPVAVVLLLAGAVVSWWRVPADGWRAGHGNNRTAIGLLTIESCDADTAHQCSFTDESSQIASARHWTFLVGVAAATLLLSLRAAPVGSRLRGQVAGLSLIASAAALVLGLGVLSFLVYLGFELSIGYPGLGGPIFLAGGVIGLRASRLVIASA